MENEKVVQGTSGAQEQVSTEKPVPQGEPTAKVETPPAPPSVEDVVRKVLAQETPKILEQGRQQGRRELQSEQDRNKAELARAQRRASSAESTVSVICTSRRSR